jgi:hypothetical protein
MNTRTLQLFTRDEMEARIAQLEAVIAKAPVVLGEWDDDVGIWIDEYEDWYRDAMAVINLDTTV